MQYELTPKVHETLARELLERFYGPGETAYFIHRKWLAGRATLTAHIVGADRDGVYERDSDGACIRGYDQATAYDRVSLSVFFKGQGFAAAPGVVDKIRARVASTSGAQHVHEILTESVNAHSEDREYGE